MMKNRFLIKILIQCLIIMALFLNTACNEVTSSTNSTPSSNSISSSLNNSSESTTDEAITETTTIENIAQETDSQKPTSTGKIYLYGEVHSNPDMLEKELEAWSDFYTNKGFRHLFIETGYAKAQLLNLWMKADNDEILDKLFVFSDGTLGDSDINKIFYKEIKDNYPETIFHGTDIEHQYDKTGKFYQSYLIDNGMYDSIEFKLSRSSIDQANKFYSMTNTTKQDIYRENKMVEYFIREFDSLENESIMGIYGAAHTGLDELDWSGSIPCMANQLKERYGEAITSIDLRAEKMNINGKEYLADYKGEADMSSFSKLYTSRKYWRIKGVYEEFKNFHTNNNVLPFDNYTFVINENDIFVIDYIRSDGKTERRYYRSDGSMYDNKPTTVEFIFDNSVE